MVELQQDFIFMASCCGAAMIERAVEGDVQVLKADGHQDDKPRKELAGAAGGEPAVDPCKDHADEQHVGYGECHRCGEDNHCEVRAGEGHAQSPRKAGNKFR